MVEVHLRVTLATGQMFRVSRRVLNVALGLLNVQMKLNRKKKDYDVKDLVLQEMRKLKKIKSDSG